MSHPPVYLDNHATTPVDPRVLDAMLPYFREHFGNAASSTHQWGWSVQAAVETARRDLTALIAASPREIVFTSGATESNNLALFGAAAQMPADRRHLVISAVEHKSVLEVAHRLHASGWRVTEVPVETDGRISLTALAEALRHGAGLVSVMAANNEVGTVQPLAEVGAAAKLAGALFHVDAAQGAGKIPLDVTAMNIDLLSFTAHKMYGPKGCGALFVRRRLTIDPLLFGGGHERGFRAGTLNVPGIVGFGTAAALARVEMVGESERLARLRDRLLSHLQNGLDGVHVTGSMTHRLPNNLHVSFDGIDGESLLIAIGDVAVSSGSACNSSSGLPSHVLAAIYGADRVPAAAIRFGLGRFTTEDEVDYAADRFIRVIRHLRASSPVPQA